MCLTFNFFLLILLPFGYAIYYKSRYSDYVDYYENLSRESAVHQNNGSLHSADSTQRSPKIYSEKYHIEDYVSGSNPIKKRHKKGFSALQDLEFERKVPQEFQPRPLADPPTFRWSKGNVPYYIDNESYDDIIVDRIRKAMDIIQSASCVVFKKLDEAPLIVKVGVKGPFWLSITNPNMERECTHYVQSGQRTETIITIGYDCMREQDIIHTLMHALGFKDEVTHPQRNTYVSVLWQNIQPQYHNLFRIQNSPSSHQTLAEYDPMSVMHFHDRSYSINGAATIAPLVPGLIINPSKTLSPLDKMKLRLVYNPECNRRRVNDIFESCKETLTNNGENLRPGEVDNALGEENDRHILNDTSKTDVNDDTVTGGATANKEDLECLDEDNAGDTYNGEETRATVNEEHSDCQDEENVVDIYNEKDTRVIANEDDSKCLNDSNAEDTYNGKDARATVNEEGSECLDDGNAEDTYNGEDTRATVNEEDSECLDDGNAEDTYNGDDARATVNEKDSECLDDGNADDTCNGEDTKATASEEYSEGLDEGNTEDTHNGEDIISNDNGTPVDDNEIPVSNDEDNAMK